MRKNFYASEAASEEALAAGVQKLILEMASLSVSRAWLVCDSKSNVSGMISSVIGEQPAKALVKGQQVRVGQSGMMTLQTALTLPPSAHSVAILACYPSRKLLDRLDGLRDAAVLIVVPWSESDVAQWVQARGPIDLLGRRQTSATAVSNPVLVKALESISGVINFSSGIADPRDKDSVIDAFRILKDGGEAIAPQEVRAWLVQKGMKPEHANQIAAIAEEPGKFRKHSSNPRWREDILQQWRAG